MSYSGDVRCETVLSISNGTKSETVEKCLIRVAYSRNPLLVSFCKVGQSFTCVTHCGIFFETVSLEEEEKG